MCKIDRVTLENDIKSKFLISVKCSNMSYHIKLHFTLIAPGSKYLVGDILGRWFVSEYRLSKPCSHFQKCTVVVLVAGIL